VHPIERLRWIARAEGESATTIAAEAAWTLGELGAEDPVAVLTASRRLVERHPGCGPLWWVCAHLLAADDPYETARRISGELLSGTAPDRVSDALRSSFTSSDVLAATTPVELLRQALARRGTYRVRLLADYAWLRRAVRELGAVADDVSGFEIDDSERALSGAAVLLVEPCLASVSGLLVEPDAGAAIESAVQMGVPAWALLGTGLVLPQVLADVAAELSGEDLELLEPDLFARAVDETGEGQIEQALVRGTCPPAAELVHRLG
jgi:hypothetical protein